MSSLPTNAADRFTNIHDGLGDKFHFGSRSGNSLSQNGDNTATLGNGNGAMNGTSNGTSIKDVEINSTNGKQEFLRRLFELILEEAVKKGTSKDALVVEFLHPSDLKKRLDLSLTECPTNNDRLLEICKDIIRYSVKTGHPYFFNQLYGGLDVHGVGGAWLTDVLNTSQYTYEVAPVFTLLEQEVIGKMLTLAGFDNGDGIFCPGGSISNMYGLNLARFRAFPDVKRTGLYELPRLCVFTSEKAHYSLKKGVALLGIGLDNLISVKTDKRGRMIPAELEAAIKKSIQEGSVPIMVNATAGNTVLGAYDPLDAIAEVCKRYNLWLHVDAAWGGGVLLSKILRHKMSGIERADSMTWNPHKMMGAPLQASAFLTKHKESLERCHSAKATYLFQQDKFYDVSFDTGDKSIQCGRKVDVLKMWMMWRAKGTQQYGKNIENLFNCARYLTDKLKSTDGFKLVIEEPECTNVCFWYIPPSLRGQDKTSDWWQQLSQVAPKIKQRMTEKGSLLIGYQPDGDLVNFFRMVISNLDVQEKDMDFVVEEIIRLGEDLWFVVN